MVEKRTNQLVFLSVAFTTTVTYMYNASTLGMYDDAPLSEDQFMRARQLGLFEIEPSEEQLSRARELKVYDRMLATTKEVWTECVSQSMSAIECKNFIDEEILTLFTGQDKLIPTRIIGKRAHEDDWYNAVVITMDDSDLTLGRDKDGWIYYTLQWEGSGVEATAEQQGEVPPVKVVETEAGAQDGGVVETVYVPDPLAEYPSPDTPESVETSAPVTSTPTTSPTTTSPPSISTKPTFPILDPLLAEEDAVEVDTFIPSGTIYEEPPIVVEPEEVLVQGATTDGAIAGEDDNALNGGVVLDGSATSSGEATERLAYELSEPPVIAEAGSRTIGPFNCKGLTGYDCCLLIKHQVRDADINGRAIQCYLDYEETTCKRKWWVESEEDYEGKKVLIYANHREMVSEDPRITGSWPMCDERWNEETRDWATVSENGRCGKDFGDAICPDNLCCSAHGYCGSGGAWCDFGCQSQCWATSDVSGLTAQQRCGEQMGGQVCHGTYCCSSYGYCGSGPDYCEVEKGCQSQCWGGGIQEVPPQIPEACKAELNICIALDMSGSVCSPDFNNPSQCTGCPSGCRDSGYDRNTCCPNFSKVKEFGIAAINWINLLQFGINSKSLSVVTFATNAQIKVNLGGDALRGVNTLDYTGGLTNHGSAIQQCQNSFNGSSGNTRNFILLVTDGVATANESGSYSESNGRAWGEERAQIAKNAGITIETVFINPAQASNNILQYMNGLSSSGSHYDISNFEDLGKAVSDIAHKIACSGDDAVTPVAAPEDQANVPPELQEVTYCGCSTCTEAVMNSYAGRHTCRKRMEWMMGWPFRQSEEEACRAISRYHGDVCKCSPNCGN